MPQKPRPHRIEVKLSDSEFRVLVAEAGRLGVTRSELLRRRLLGAAEQTMPVSAPPRREVTLAQLAEAAAGGNVTAMTSLARELRLAPLEAERPALVTSKAVKLSDLPPGALREIR